MLKIRLIYLLLFALPIFTHAQLQPDPPFNCTACEAWNQPLKAFRIHGNTWYVGTAGLAAILITSTDGNGAPAHVLIDGALPQSAALIDANITLAGYDTRDVRYILNSHAHFDHAGGIAALQRYSGARVLVSEPSLAAFQTGQVPAHDPQAGYAPDNGFPPVANVEVIADGGEVRIGELALTLHQTPGHTPGGSSWSWRSCEGDECRTILYLDSLGTVSAPGFVFSVPQTALGDMTTAEQLQGSIDFLRGFDCEILLAPHPGYFGLGEKLKQRELGAAGNPFYAPKDCAKYADQFQQALDKRLVQEREAAGSAGRE